MLTLNFWMLVYLNLIKKNRTFNISIFQYFSLNITKNNQQPTSNKKSACTNRREVSGLSGNQFALEHEMMISLVNKNTIVNATLYCSCKTSETDTAWYEARACVITFPLWLIWLLFESMNSMTPLEIDNSWWSIIISTVWRQKVRFYQ